MRRIDKIVTAVLIIGIVLLGAAFAVASFYDPIQAAFFSRTEKVLGIPVEWQLNF